jgi:hypothetical protein
MISKTEGILDARAVLALGPGASGEEVRIAYRRLARRYHPDASGDPSTAGRFARVTRAYKVLTALPPSRLPPAGLSARYRRVIEAGDDLFALGQILASESDGGARAEAAKRLGLSGRTAAYVFLRRALYDADEAVQEAAIRAVALLGARQAQGEVAALYARAAKGLRTVILDTAEATGEAVFAGALEAAKTDSDPVLRSRALRLLLRP